MHEKNMREAIFVKIKSTQSCAWRWLNIKTKIISINYSKSFSVRLYISFPQPLYQPLASQSTFNVVFLLLRLYTDAALILICYETFKRLLKLIKQVVCRLCCILLAKKICRLHIIFICFSEIKFIYILIKVYVATLFYAITTSNTFLFGLLIILLMELFKFYIICNYV